MQPYCESCKKAILPEYNFCPSCGLKLKDIPLTVTAAKQISIYMVSLLLPPLGLFPGIKYLAKGDSHSKHIGLIALFLTLLSTILSLWLFFGFIQEANKTLNQQINLKQLGY